MARDSSKLDQFRNMNSEILIRNLSTFFTVLVYKCLSMSSNMDGIAILFQELIPFVGTFFYIVSL